MLKKAVIVFLVLVIAAVAAQFFIFFKQARELEKNLAAKEDKIRLLEKENEEIKLRIEYFSHPENLEKELRARFNYRRPDEKMIIITP